jgi:hypothetical protein
VVVKTILLVSSCNSLNHELYSTSKPSMLVVRGRFIIKWLWTSSQNLVKMMTSGRIQMKTHRTLGTSWMRQMKRKFLMTRPKSGLQGTIKFGRSVNKNVITIDKSSRFLCRSSGSGIAENTSVWRPVQPAAPVLSIHLYQYSMRSRESRLESFLRFTNTSNSIIKVASGPSISEGSTGRRRSTKIPPSRKGGKKSCLHRLRLQSEAGLAESSGCWNQKNSVKR